MKFSIAVKDERISLIPEKKTNEENLQSNLVNYRVSECEDFTFMLRIEGAWLAKIGKDRKERKQKKNKSEKEKKIEKMDVERKSKRKNTEKERRNILKRKKRKGIETDKKEIK